MSPLRAAIDKVLRPTNHTDFVVAPLDQMFVLWTAVHRISRSGVVIGPDQRVTPLEALVEPMAIKDIRVVETIKEGKTIYEANRACQAGLAEAARSTILSRQPWQDEPRA